MDKLLKYYIAGEGVDPISTETMPVMNPASATQLGTVALGNEADVDRAVVAASSAFVTYSQTTLIMARFCCESQLEYAV